MHRTFLSLCTAAALTFVVGCGDKDDGDTAGTTDHGDHDHDGGGGDGDAAAGETVYASSCAACHGASGEGGSGPAMDSVVPGHSAADIAEIAKEGEGSMPPILSDDTDAANVGAYAVATWGP